MFTRRPGERMTRNRIQLNASAAVAPSTPLTILGSLAWWVRADLGITIGTGVSAWADQSGNGVNFAQATGASQPAFIAGAINGQPAVRGDGVDDFMRAAWARAAPGTQPFYVWVILNQVTYISGRGVFGDFSAAGCEMRMQTAVSPEIQMYNGTFTNTNANATLGTYRRLESQFDNTPSSYLKIGATNVAGNPGNDAGSGSFDLFSVGPVGLVPSNIEIAEAFAFLGAPTVPQRTALDAYCTARYGAGLV